MPVRNCAVSAQSQDGIRNGVSKLHCQKIDRVSAFSGGKVFPPVFSFWNHDAGALPASGPAEIQEADGISFLAKMLGIGPEQKRSKIGISGHAGLLFRIISSHVILPLNYSLGMYRINLTGVLVSATEEMRFSCFLYAAEIAVSSDGRFGCLFLKKPSVVIVSKNLVKAF